MIELVSDNTWTYLKTDDSDVTNLVKNILRYKADGYKYAWAYKAGKWDGWTSLYDAKNDRFRRGLTGRVADILSDENCQFKLVQAPTVDTPTVQHNLKSGVIRPYDFQSKIVEIASRNDMGIVVSKVGTGKTVMISLAVNGLSKISLVLVIDLVLLDQMHQALSKYFNQDIGMVGDSEFDLQNITVSTTQSLASILSNPGPKQKSLMKFMENVGLVIADEAHRFSIKSIDETLPLFTHTKKFFAVSGTPYGWGDKTPKKQDLVLEQHFGQVIYDTKGNDFVELGLKVPIYVQVEKVTPRKSKYVEFRKYNSFKESYDLDTTKNYRAALENEILNNPEYHQMVADKTKKLVEAGKTVFVYAAHNLEFSAALHKLMPEAEIIVGSTSRLERRKIYDSMRNRTSKILISDLGITGLDIPSLDAIVVASDITDIRQLAGRVSRASPGKFAGIVFEFFIVGCDYLSAHHETRRSQYVHEGYTVIG